MFSLLRSHGLLGLLFFLSTLVIPPALSSAPRTPQKLAPAIIPRPEKIQVSSGVFRLSSRTRVVLDSEEEGARELAEELASDLGRATGFPVALEVQARPGVPHEALVLRTDKRLSHLGPEGYLLAVSKNGMSIEALTPAGLFYGLQTFAQLLPPSWETGRLTSGLAWEIPCVRIEDRPRFRWRGVHLDVGRHFFPVESIKRYIDLMAKYKMNTFHWHLTEDQGWRIEIKKYPRLTEVGAWRKETMDNNQPHGGFYTQEEIRDVVSYARRRFVTIVPEIEMPGHCQAALAAYPELSCSGGPFRVGTEWGIIYDVYCAGNEKTFEFLEAVLSEVIELFPGEFIHIGGDEVPKLRWQNCVKCQARIKEEGLADETELQSYFIHRIEKFLNARGRRLIGWDEILEGGLAPNAAVMSWRGTAGGVEAARSGHDVVMTPTSHCYFDYYQGRYDEPRAIGGFLPIEKVYAYEPIPPELKPEEAGHILGAQANLWTEYMPVFDQVEYMLLPRLLALSEVVWTAKDLRRFDDFSGRLVRHYDRLAAMGVNFRLPPPEGLGGRRINFTPFVLEVGLPYPGAEVRYTLDGAEPSQASPLYRQPLEISQSAILKARTFLAGGRSSRTVRTFISLVDEEKNGLEFAYYEGSWSRLPRLDDLSPLRTGRVYDLLLESIKPRERDFAVRFRGFIDIPAPGEYTFTLICDDGAEIRLGEKQVIRNEGLFGIREMRQTIFLEAGKVPLVVSYFQKSGGAQLEVWCEGPGLEKQPLPPHWFFLH